MFTWLNNVCFRVDRMHNVRNILDRRRRQRQTISLTVLAAQKDYHYYKSHEKHNTNYDADDGSGGHAFVVEVDTVLG